MSDRNVLTRIDNRLLHGQVIQAWLPYLSVSELVVADDRAASDPALKELYSLGIPGGVDFKVIPILGLPVWAAGRNQDKNALVLMADVYDAVRAYMAGYRFGSLNIGNVHSMPGRLPVSDGIYLSVPELKALYRFMRRGIIVEVRKVPGDTALIPPSPEDVG